MNTKILATVLAFLMLAVNVSASGGVPMMLNGIVTSNNVPTSTTVTITNLETGVHVDINTNGAGEFLYMLNDFPGIIRIGDRISVSALGETQVINWNGDLATVYIEGVITGCPICPDVPTCQTCETCEVCEICPPIPEDTTPYAECDECCPITGEPDLFPLVGAIGVTALVTILGGLSVAKRYKLIEIIQIWNDLTPGEGIKPTLRRNKDGSLDLSLKSHKHAGHEYYHSIYTIHSTYKHPKGVVNPDYDENGKYIGE